jgi:hypothetical protein
VSRFRSRVLVTATGLAVLAAATLVTFASVGCGDEASVSATTPYNRSTPGVYIVSVESFGAGFAGFVRDANPTCG